MKQLLCTGASVSIHVLGVWAPFCVQRLCTSISTPGQRSVTCFFWRGGFYCALRRRGTCRSNGNTTSAKTVCNRVQPLPRKCLGRESSSSHESIPLRNFTSLNTSQLSHHYDTCTSLPSQPVLLQPILDGKKRQNAATVDIKLTAIQRQNPGTLPRIADANLAVLPRQKNAAVFCYRFNSRTRPPLNPETDHIQAEVTRQSLLPQLFFV